MPKTVDFVIIGGGAAAFAAAIRANEIGKKTIMINTGLPLGGTCVNVGCVPSKALIHAGKVIYQSQNHNIPGIDLTLNNFTFSDVIKDELNTVEQSRLDKYVKVLAQLSNVTHIEGFATFVDEHTIEVNNDTIQAEKFLIATGSTSLPVPIAGIEDVGYITHIEALKLEKQPKSLLIFGAGAIGLEFAQMYARFGTKVTVLQRSATVMSVTEPEIAKRIEEISISEGIDIYTGVTFKSFKKSGEEKIAIFEHEGVEKKISAEEILIGTGKTPNTEKLNLKSTGVQVNDHKAITVNTDYSTNVAHIYAVGDVISLPLRLETTAGREGTYATGNALLGEKKSVDYHSVPWTVFTDPEITGVGLTDAQAIKQGFSCKCRTIEFDIVPKAQIIKEMKGMIKMVTDKKTREILGIHILAPHAGDLIATAMLIIKNKMTIDDVLDTLPVFPTLSEAIRIVAQSFDSDVNKLSCCT